MRTRDAAWSLASRCEALLAAALDTPVTGGIDPAAAVAALSAGHVAVLVSPPTITPDTWDIAEATFRATIAVPHHPDADADGAWTALDAALAAIWPAVPFTTARPVALGTAQGGSYAAYELTITIATACKE